MFVPESKKPLEWLSLLSVRSNLPLLSPPRAEYPNTTLFIRPSAIHSAVKYSARAFVNQKNPRIRAWGPSAIGSFFFLERASERAQAVNPHSQPHIQLLLIFFLLFLGLSIVPALPYIFDHRTSSSSSSPPPFPPSPSSPSSLSSLSLSLLLSPKLTYPSPP